MNKTTATWILGFLGWAASYALFARWLAAHEWDFFGGWAEAFAASDFATGLLSDLVVVTIMMLAVAIWERRRLGPRWTAAILACLCLSVSMSLAVYLIGMWRTRSAGEGSAP
ncbi:MAG: DUF2834 domain-containing protein [Nannocystaceae bacterium]|nr:DUF2834 domain-containing protein [Nannocystaceae bacterium]